MTLDGLTLRGIAEELQSLVGAKIEKSLRIIKGIVIHSIGRSTYVQKNA